MESTKHKVPQESTGRNVAKGVKMFLLKDGTHGYIDEEEKHHIKDRNFYLYRGHLTASIHSKKTKLVWLLGYSGRVIYKDGNPRNCQHCNIVAYDRKKDELTTEFISDEEWEVLKRKAKEEGELNFVTQVIFIRTRSMSFPRYEYTQNKLLTDFYTLFHCLQKDLKNLNCGGALARQMMADAMLMSRKRKFPSADEVWDNQEYFKRLIRGMVNLNASKFNTNRINTTYACNFYKVSNFPPLVARNLYDYYFLSSIFEKRVLDPCSGFGGRLTGFWASKSCRSYIGIDPNPRLITPYQKMNQWFYENTKSAFDFEKEVRMIQACAEDFDYSTIEPVDIIFTSPPYFDLEIYGEEKEQSCIRYPSIEEWTHKFLLKMIEKCVECLKDEGILAINIKQSDQWKYPTIDLMIQKVTSEEVGLTLKETLYLPLNLRPGAKKEKSREPIYIFARM